MAKPVPAQNQPLHLSISEEIRQWILSGQYLPGALLPSEHQLMSQFGVSRITVRRAMSNLAHQGLVISRHGKGVFVKQQRKVTYALSSPFVLFDEEMTRQGVTNSIQNLIFQSAIAPDEVRQTLNLAAKDAIVYFQKKLLLIDDAPVAIDATYILAELGETLAAELKYRMTFSVLEQNGIPIERVAATIACTQADYETSAYLDMPLGSSLLVYSHTAYTTGNKPVVCGEALSRGDRLCYSVELTKSR